MDNSYGGKMFLIAEWLFLVDPINVIILSQINRETYSILASIRKNIQQLIKPELKMSHTIRYLSIFQGNILSDQGPEMEFVWLSGKVLPTRNDVEFTIEIIEQVQAIGLCNGDNTEAWSLETNGCLSHLSRNQDGKVKIRPKHYNIPLEYSTKANDILILYDDYLRSRQFPPKSKIRFVVNRLSGLALISINGNPWEYFLQGISNEAIFRPFVLVSSFNKLSENFKFIGPYKILSDQDFLKEQLAFSAVLNNMSQSCDFVGWEEEEAINNALRFGVEESLVNKMTIWLKDKLSIEERIRQAEENLYYDTFDITDDIYYCDKF